MDKDKGASLSNTSGRLMATGPKQSAHEKKTAQVVQKAYGLLRYNSGYLSHAAFEWFKSYGLPPPQNFLRVDASPVATTVKAGAFTIGIVYFPEGSLEFGAPSKDQITACLNYGKKLRNSVQLLIGVSPWGLTEEKKILSQANGIFDCFLGGGDGIGFSYSVLDEAPGVLWIRPNAKGRSVNTVNFYTIPSRQGPFKWLEQTTFTAEQTYLDTSIPPNRPMERLLRPLETSN